jgi:ankyrin repeat protein
MRKLLTFPIAATWALSAQPQAKVDFIRDIEPILSQKCYSCHGPGVQQSGLRLDRRQAAMRGGDYGPVIIPGKSAESKLIRRVISGDGGLQMPPTGALEKDEIALLRAWIDQGADYRIEVREEAPPKPVDPKVLRWITAVRNDDRAAIANVPASEFAAARDNGGSTLLHHAAGFASVSTIEAVLAKGADVRAVNRRRSTPLHWAIHDEAKVRLLVASGANVNAKQADGRTPLFQAASMGGNSTSIVRFLLENGADPNLAAANGQTPLMVAANRGNVEVVRMLIAQKVNVNARSGNGATALIAAASGGSAQIVKLLLDQGADPNIRTKKNDSALGEAATAGVEESVRLLLAKGASVDAPDDRGYTPLMYAAASDAVPTTIVKLLLSKGADPKATGEGQTAASLAAKRGDTESARILHAKAVVPPTGVMVRPAGTDLTASIPEAVHSALGLMAKQSENFIRIGGCNSCHAQDLVSAAAALARDRGLKAPKSIAQLPDAMRGVSAERTMDFGVIGPGSVAWELFDLGMNGASRDAYTDAVVRYLKAMQSPEGHWRTPQSRRPPMSAGNYQTTALSIYALKTFGMPVEAADTAKRIERAGAWLESAEPGNTQDRAFQLLGLSWAGASRGVIQKAAAQLAATQRSDGGWNQLPSMAWSDAYATGQAMYALHIAGRMSTRHAQYQKGIAYLLRTQASDGSWHVKTRSIWFQPYFESGFPYGEDQWISVAGSAWASMALAFAADGTAVPSASRASK